MITIYVRRRLADSVWKNIVCDIFSNIGIQCRFVIKRRHTKRRHIFTIPFRVKLIHLIPLAFYHHYSNAASRELSKRAQDERSDGVREYARCLVWRGVNDLVRRSAVRRNDGDAMVRHWKFDMLEFHSKRHPKYFLLGHNFLTSVHGGVSQRLAHQMRWNRTVNVNGGENGNIAMDLYNEFLNGYFKGNLLLLTVWRWKMLCKL